MSLKVPLQFDETELAILLAICVELAVQKQLYDLDASPLPHPADMPRTMALTGAIAQLSMEEYSGN